MTGDGDRLDEIERTARYLRLCDLLPHTLWLVRELRDARAENERWRAAQASHADVYERLTAELAAERAKVERVEARLDEVERHQDGLTDVTTIRIAAVRAALAGDEQIRTTISNTSMPPEEYFR